MILSILQEIFIWSEGLSSWQSDAIARLILNSPLSSNDIDDLFALLKSEHGIPDPKNRVPKPLTADQIPAPVGNDVNIKLHQIKNLKYVNAIAENQVLPINPKGLTVIYGDNGSGKSGYSRVLKTACRARDQSEIIYPNANIAPEESENAKAEFSIEVDGQIQDFSWENGKTSPPELSSLAIFDSRCARAYLDNEDDFSYVPYGLDVFSGLAKTYNQIKALVEAEHSQNSVDLSSYAHLNSDTEVGKLIASLSYKTKLEQIDALANLTPEELVLQKELQKGLEENNPKDKARQIRLRAQRFGTIVNNIIKKLALVSEGVVDNLQGLSSTYRTAQLASELAVKQFNAGENLLPGTGAETWRELFEAARKFSVESHPESTFPELGEESPCPLCQQPLNQGAHRLIKFETFINQAAEKNTKVHRAALALVYKKFIAQDLTLSIDDATYSEIESIDEKLVAEIRAFEKAMATKQNDVKDAIISHKWDKVKYVIPSPAPRLQTILDALKAEAEILEKISVEAAREKLVKQNIELVERIKLRDIKASVVKSVSRLAHQKKLKKCLLAVRTNPISLKASEMTQKAISKDLATALDVEFKALGVSSLKVVIKSRTDKGKPLHKLKLELSQSRRPIDILSEGEQRAVALGSFLAETGLSGAKGGIVFDDPVSSLDHRRRERVSKRLVQEAAIRQVIIFTHDIYFLCLLIDSANNQGVSFTTQSLTRTSDGFGVATSDLPFEGVNTKKRIGILKDKQQTIAKLYKDGEEQEHRKQTVNAYVQLRIAWERAVEEVLLRSVILRFRKGVETNRLDSVMVEDEDYAKINQGMSKCSNYTHDKALMGGVSVPEPDELLSDIMNLESWKKENEQRANETQKRRKTKN